eukprot:gene7041-9616_t
MSFDELKPEDNIDVYVKVVPDLLTIPFNYPCISKTKTLHLYSIKVFPNRSSSKVCESLKCNEANNILYPEIEPINTIDNMNKIGFALLNKLPEEVIMSGGDATDISTSSAMNELNTNKMSLNSPFNFYFKHQISGHGKLVYLGAYELTIETLILLQRFHRAVLCNQDDVLLENPEEFISLDHPIKIPMDLISDEDWVKSSNGAWILAIPLVDFMHNIETSSRYEEVFADYIVNNYEQFHTYIRNACCEAQILMHNIRVIHQKHRINYNNCECEDPKKCKCLASPITNHANTKEYLPLLSKITNNIDYIVTVDDHAICTTLNSALFPLISEIDINTPFIKKKDKETKVIKELSHAEHYKNSEKYTDFIDLIDNLSSSSTNTQEMVLLKELSNYLDRKVIHFSPVTEEKLVKKDKNSGGLTYTLPHFCRYLGNSKWYYASIALPSMLYKLQTVIMAYEAKHYIINKIRSFQMYDPSKQSKSDEKSFDVSNAHSSLNNGKKRLKTSFEDDANIIKMSIEEANNPVIFSEPVDIPVSLILEALTPTLIEEEFKNKSERLELFGDSFLKYIIAVQLFLLYPEYEEGQLTLQRTYYITNNFLAKKALDNDLICYLRAIPFKSTKHNNLPFYFQPCGMPFLPSGSMVSNIKLSNNINNNKNNNLETSSINQSIELQQNEEILLKTENDFKYNIWCIDIHRTKQERFPWLTAKTLKLKKISDMMEALIGLYCLTTGSNGAIAFMKSFQIWPDFDSESMDIINFSGLNLHKNKYYLNNPPSFNTQQ